MVENNEHIRPLLCKSLFSVALVSIIMRDVVITYFFFFWNNTFYRMVQGMNITSFICDSFHSMDTWFFSLNENYKFFKSNLKCALFSFITRNEHGRHLIKYKNLKIWKPWSIFIGKRRGRWFGHLARMDHTTRARRIL